MKYGQLLGLIALISLFCAYLSLLEKSGGSEFDCHGQDERLASLVVDGISLGSDPTDEQGKACFSKRDSTLIWSDKKLGVLQIEGQEARWNLGGRAFAKRGDPFGDQAYQFLSSSKGSWRYLETATGKVFHFKKNPSIAALEAGSSSKSVIEEIAIEVVDGRVNKIRVSWFRDLAAFGVERLSSSEKQVVQAIRQQSRNYKILEGPLLVIPAPR